MSACEIYYQMTLSEKGGSIVHPQSCKWQHFIHWNLNFCLLSHDLRNLHLLLFWKSFDLTFKFTSIHEKFKMQIPMRTSSNFFLRNTNIHKSMSIYRNIITGVGDRGYVILAVCTEPLPRKTHQHGNCYPRVYRYLFVFLNTSPKGLVPVHCYDQQKKQLRCTCM